ALAAARCRGRLRRVCRGALGLPEATHGRPGRFPPRGLGGAPGRRGTVHDQLRQPLSLLLSVNARHPADSTCRPAPRCRPGRSPALRRLRRRLVRLQSAVPGDRAARPGERPGADIHGPGRARAAGRNPGLVGHAIVPATRLSSADWWIARAWTGDPPVAGPVVRVPRGTRPRAAPDGGTVAGG